jgi:hypothetical protein
MNRLVCLGWISKPERKEGSTTQNPAQTPTALLDIVTARPSHNCNFELILRQRNAFCPLPNVRTDSNYGRSRSSQCCVTGMPLQSLSSKWHAAKARRGGMFLCDLRPRSNAGAGPFSTQPSGPRFLWRIFASLPQPVSQRIQALRSLLQIRPNSSWRL